MSGRAGERLRAVAPARGGGDSPTPSSRGARGVSGASAAYLPAGVPSLGHVEVRFSGLAVLPKQIDALALPTAPPKPSDRRGFRWRLAKRSRSRRTFWDRSCAPRSRLVSTLWRCSRFWRSNRRRAVSCSEGWKDNRLGGRPMTTGLCTHMHAVFPIVTSIFSNFHFCLMCNSVPRVQSRAKPPSQRLSPGFLRRGTLVGSAGGARGRGANGGVEVLPAGACCIRAPSRRRVQCLWRRLLTTPFFLDRRE